MPKSALKVHTKLLAKAAAADTEGLVCVQQHDHQCQQQQILSHKHQLATQQKQESNNEVCND